MKKKLAAFLLALIMVAQVLVPGTSWAIRDSEDTSQPSNNFVQVGMTSAENYPKLTNRVILDIQREATQKARENMEEKDGVTTFNTPYLPGQNIPDKDKPRIVGKVSADFKTKGLDGGTFDWEGVFGKDSNGNPGKAKLVFQQWLDNKETDVSYELEVSKDGTYSWKDWEGQPARIPLYSKGLQPYTYSVYLDQDVSEKVKLLIYRIAGTPGSAGYEKDPETGLNVANIVIDLSIQQVASTKFVSKWYTNLEEKSRPPVNGEFNNKIDGYPGYFPFSTKDGGSIIIRNDKMYNSDYEDPGYSEYNSSKLVKTPEVKVTEGLEYADENDETGSPTYNIDEASKTITTLDKKHKFKYDFTYDVINGGKLTMTEILPITFDANEGEFDSLDEGADQKIVREVEYGKDLTDEVEKPKKALETFKGWAETKDGTPLSEEKFKEATKNITEAKTFYATWGNNDITAEELVVHESFKNGADWINEFIPTMDELAKQIRIKGEDGKYTPLNIDDHGFAVLDDSEQEIKSIDLANRLYDKLKEDDNTEVSRYTNIKVRVDFKKTGKNVVVDVPIKVIKNIYEAKTKEGRPIYVPKDYVKVTLDPTTKATDPQKTYFYVNPKAKVVIPGQDPTGRDDYLFVGWKAPKTPDNEVFKLDDRHQFTDKTTVIEAQYTKDVLPETNDDGTKNEKPEGFVEVKFVPTEKGTMDGPKTFWVKKDRDVIIPVKDPVGNQYYTFKEWKIGDVKTGETYNPNTARKFTAEETTITATYKEAEDIIEYNPKEPITKPDGYVRVTFEADSGLKLTESKAYYVKKNAGIKLGNSKLVKPAYKEETGYKFKEWDKKDALVIEAADVVVTAKAESFKDVIPKINSEGGENKKPAGYITVKFSTETNGKIKGTDKTEKVVYVNPNKAVELTTYAPKVTPNTGYDFADWDTQIDKKIQYADGDKIKALYNKKGDVIPQINDDGSTNKKPDGYFTVTFLKGDHGELSGKTVYYVKPKTEVTVPAPKVNPNTGWKQKDGDDAWNEELTQTFTKDTDITAQYDSIKDIIPRDEGGKENSKPDGYVTVTFKKGEHGKLEGKTVYYVNPEAGKKLDDITKPKVSPETGYKADGWDKEDTLEIKDNITVTAKYLPLDDVIPKTKEDESEKPDSYIKVTFKTTDKGGNIEKVVYINPNKAVALDKYAPEVTPIDGYEFAGWDKPITEKVQYNDNDVITAQFNEIGLISKVEKPGYVKVVFKEGEHGSLEGDINVWIKPDVDVRIPSPNVIAAEGYKFDGWDKNLKVKLSLDDSPYEITAQYKDIKEGGDTPINPNFKIKDIVTLPFDVNKGDSVDGRDWYKQVVPGDDYEIKRVDVNNPSEADTSKGNAFTSVKATITIRNKNTQEETTVESLIWIYVKEPCNNTCPNPGDNPGGGGSITPTPDPTEPGDDDPDIGGDDKEKDPDNKEETPDEDKDKDPDNKEETPDKDKEETPEKPGDKDPKKPGQNQPPVKNDSKKKQGQTGTKIVKTIGQTGTKVINQVKNFLNPTTGIISNYGLYIGLMAASSVGLFFTRDKKNEDEE